MVYGTTLSSLAVRFPGPGGPFARFHEAPPAIMAPEPAWQCLHRVATPPSRLGLFSGSKHNTDFPNFAASVGPGRRFTVFFSQTVSQCRAARATSAEVLTDQRL